MASLSISETVGSVLAQYSLSEPKNIRLMEASNRNENFVILDANKNKYILRRYRRNDDRKRALFQLKLQQHLFDNNFPTSEIVKTTSNELIVIINETVWALFTFMEGKEYNFSRLEQAAEAGRRLAQFHNILSSFHEVQTYLDYNLPIRKAYIKYMSNLEQIERMFLNQGVDKELSDCRRWWEKLINDLPLQDLDRLPSGWIHRDYHGRNMLFAGDKMCGLFDFDELTNGPFACDIAFGIHMFGRESRGSRKIRPEFARSFFNEYSNIRPVTRDEMEAIPSLLLFAFLPQAAYYVNHERDGDDVREMLIREVTVLPKVVIEVEQLKVILTII